MYCNNCGEEIKDGFDFCPNCGSNVSSNGVHGNNSGNSPKITEKKDKAKKGNKKTRIAIAVILVVLVVLNFVQFFDRSYEFDTIYNSRGGQTHDELEKTDIDIKKLNANEIDIGDYIIFGRYEQDNDSSDGREEIEWRVLDKATADSDGRKCILVISKYVLDCMPYNEEYEDVTWETCDLREWLNNEFYYGAFSEAERKQLLTIKNNNPDASFYSSSWGGKGGNDTSDNVFLLSFEQAENLFIDYDDIECSPTDYAMWNGNFTRRNHHCYWWLRSPGLDQRYAMNVYDDGLLYDGGVNDGNFGVRPALWIYLD